jgi:hypothetical protein
VDAVCWPPAELDCEPWLDADCDPDCPEDCELLWLELDDCDDDCDDDCWPLGCDGEGIGMLDDELWLTGCGVWQATMSAPSAVTRAIRKITMACLSSVLARNTRLGFSPLSLGSG